MRTTCYALVLVLAVCTWCTAAETKQNSNKVAKSDGIDDLLHRIKRHVSSNPSSLLPVQKGNAKKVAETDDLETLKRKKRSAEQDVAPSLVRVRRDETENMDSSLQKMKRIKREAEEAVHVNEEPAVQRTRRDTPQRKRRNAILKKVNRASE